MSAQDPHSDILEDAGDCAYAPPRPQQTTGSRQQPDASGASHSTTVLQIDGSKRRWHPAVVLPVTFVLAALVVLTASWLLLNHQAQTSVTNTKVPATRSARAQNQHAVPKRRSPAAATIRSSVRSRQRGAPDATVMQQEARPATEWCGYQCASATRSSAQQSRELPQRQHSSSSGTSETSAESASDEFGFEP